MLRGNGRINYADEPATKLRRTNSKQNFGGRTSNGGVMTVICAVKLFYASQDSMHVYVVLTAIGDGILTGFAYPADLLTSLAHALRSRPLCESMHFARWAGQALSGMSLTALNVDKYIYFGHPLRYRLFTSKCTVAVSLLITILSFGFVSSLWISRTAHVLRNCGFWIPPSRDYVYDIAVAIFTVIPMVSSVLLSTYLYFLTRRRTAIKRRAQPGLTAKLESLCVISATTMWTAFTLLPYRVFLLVEVHAASEISCVDAWTWTALGFFWALIVNAIVNPLLTLTVYPPYRKMLMRMMSFNRARTA